MLQDEYPDLLAGDDVTAVAGAAMGVLEYLDQAGLVEALDITGDAGRLVYHGHCNQKAMRTAHHAATVLGDVGYAVEALDSGCCGMAGSFGYEAEHYDLSMAIGGILAEEVREADGDRVVASGASCRAQLAALLDDRPRHPIEAVDAAVGG